MIVNQYLTVYIIGELNDHWTFKKFIELFDIIFSSKETIYYGRIYLLFNGTYNNDQKVSKKF